MLPLTSNEAIPSTHKRTGIDKVVAGHFLVGEERHDELLRGLIVRKRAVASSEETEHQGRVGGELVRNHGARRGRWWCWCWWCRKLALADLRERRENGALPLSILPRERRAIAGRREEERARNEDGRST